MKNIRHLLYSLSLVLLALSCVEDKIPSFAQLADIPCVLKADRSEIPFSAQGESKQLVIKSQNVSWELTGVPSWLTLSQKSGNGEAIVTLTAAENKGVDNTRVAVLQLRSTTAKYEFSKSVTITQSAASICLTTSETSLTLAPQAVQKNITINSNVEWEAVSSAEWLGLTKTNATTLSLNASENTTAGTRTATVTLRRVGTTQALATISVVQSEAGITGSTETVTFDVDGGIKSVNIEADVAWHATTSAASWLSVTPTNGAGGKVSLGISALANNSAAARSAYVYVKIGTEQKLAIPVSQEGISFNVVGTLENFAADGSTKQKLTVESNTAWAVLSCPEWLTVTPSQGSKGTTEITLQVAANNSLDSRSATLRIGIEGLTIYPDITVAQEGVTIDLGDRSLDFGWESAEREVKITFPGSWSAMTSDDWLSLSRSSGLGEETIVVTAAANPGEDARTGTITVASEGRSMKITAVQQGQYLKINSTAGEVGAMGGSISLAVTTSVGAAASVEYQGTAKDWVTFDADDKGNYTLSVVYNPSINSRTAQFVIKPTMSGTNTTCSSGVKFAIAQKGRSLSANVSKIAISLAGGTSGTYTITADGGYAITKPEADDWYTLQQDSANCTFSIVATESTTGENRTSQITVSLTGLPSGETKDLVIGVLQYDLYNGHDAVDLGLPSGVKWATCNVGATKPEEYGGYYAWGETEEKEDYSLQTYIWCNGSYDSLTKYCTDSYRGTVDNKTVLEPEDDVAHVKWGGGWRMPTKTEFEELLNKCDWVWTTQNGVNGCMVTSRTNGNSIFLPAAGIRSGVTGGDMGETGLYWSSWLESRESLGSDDLNFTKNKQEFTSHYRYIGLPVRPVCGEPAVPVERYAVYVVSAGNGNVDLEYHNSTSAEFEAGATVTVVATPDEGYAFDGWYVDGNEEPVSTDAEYTFTVSGDVALEARFEKAEINGHGYVDLGLPSGTKWATCNVGATKPEDYGGYYAWGETEEKENYDLSTYKWCKGSSTTMTKYCIDGDYGTVDNKTVLDPEDDVAHVKWGGSWRMPTEAEMSELRNNCTWTWTTRNGVNGYKVTSRTNGNSIFLPAAGCRYGAALLGSGNSGGCWSSSLDGSGSDYACGLYFRSGYVGIYDYRYYGFSVRPVRGGDVAPVAKYTVSVSSAGNGSVGIKDAEGTSQAFLPGTEVTVIATPNENCDFIGWFVADAVSPVSTDIEYTFEVTEDIALTAKFDSGVYINETFASSFGVFSTEETVGNFPWVVEYGTAKAESYVDGANNAATSWMVSSPVDFTNETEAYVAFDYIIRYSESGKVAANHSLLISADYAGNAADATWTDLPYNAVEGADWATFYKANVAVPAEFMGKANITFALRYTATTKSSTWEVKNFVVAHGKAETTETPEEPETPSETAEYTVAEAIAAYTGVAKPAVVKGYIVGTVNGMVYIEGCSFSGTAEIKTNLLLADNPNETDYNNCIPVQLPSGAVRDALNLVDNPSNYKKFVTLRGSLEKYFSVAGLKSVSAYSIDGVTSDEPETPAAPANAYINEAFTNGFGSFTTQETVGNYPWVSDAQYGAKASGYADGASQDAESWLVSPAINFANETTAYIAFDYVINKGDASAAAANHKLLITSNYTGDVATTQWTEINYGAVNNNSWSFQNTGNIALPESMMGESAVVIAFKYMSTTANSSTWEVKNVVVSSGTGATP